MRWTAISLGGKVSSRPGRGSGAGTGIAKRSGAGEGAGFPAPSLGAAGSRPSTGPSFAGPDSPSPAASGFSFAGRGALKASTRRSTTGVPGFVSFAGSGLTTPLRIRRSRARVAATWKRRRPSSESRDSPASISSP